MTVEERDRWQRFNWGLRHCLHNAATHENTNIIFELSNLLFAFARPNMLDFQAVHEVDEEIIRYMRGLNDPLYGSKKPG